MKDRKDIKLILKIDKSDWDTFVYFLRDFLKSWGWNIKSITTYEGKKGKTARIWINFVGWEEDNEEKNKVGFKSTKRIVKVVKINPNSDISFKKTKRIVKIVRIKSLSDKELDNFC